MLDASEIAKTFDLIRPYLRRTPVVRVGGAEFGVEAETIALKLEQLQHAGSFKTRGAFANLILREVPQSGVVAASGGNHGAAVAYAAMKLAVAATIFVPTIANAAKIARIKATGANLVVAGARYADALAASEIWRAQHGAMAVHAFDQRETVLGQGTLAAEMNEQIDTVDTVLAGVGGGGLIGGIAAWFAGGARVIGVEPTGSPTLANALKAGGPVDAPAEGIAADSLAPKRVGELPFAIARRYVERVLLVSDEAIRQSQMALWDQLRIVAEPGGAAAFAALLSRQYVPAPGESVAVVISGGNTDAVRFER